MPSLPRAGSTFAISFFAVFLVLSLVFLALEPALAAVLRVVILAGGLALQLYLRRRPMKGAPDRTIG